MPPVIFQGERIREGAKPPLSYTPLSSQNNSVLARYHRLERGKG